MSLAPSDLLSRYAPQPTTGLDHILEDVLDRAADPTAAPTRKDRGVRGWLVMSLAASVLAVTLLVWPILVGTPQPAAALVTLANTAGEGNHFVIPPGKFQRLVSIENPDGVQGDVLDAYPRLVETWTDSSGNITAYSTEGRARKETSGYVPEEEQNPISGYPGASMTYLRSLPTDPRELEAALRSTLDDVAPLDPGSATRDEQLFDFYTEVLWRGYASAELNRAMIAAMSNLNNISVERSTSYLGQPCLRVTLTLPARAGLTSGVCFDESSAAIVESLMTGPTSPDFLTVVTSREIVDHGPTRPVDPPRTDN